MQLTIFNELNVVILFVISAEIKEDHELNWIAEPEYFIVTLLITFVIHGIAEQSSVIQKSPGSKSFDI